jgi:hypothetical protein
MSIGDLADLLVLSLSNKLPQKISVVVSTDDKSDNSTTSWDSSIGNLISDFKPIKSQNHRSQIVLLLSVLTLVTSLLFKSVASVLRIILSHAFKS